MTDLIKYTQISRIFGKLYKEGYHLGVDYLAPFDTPAYAISSGIVKFSLELNGFGSLDPSTTGGFVAIEHTNKDGIKFLALYGHLRRFVIQDEPVKKGDIIGKIINFKNGTAVIPHLHFGIYENTDIVLNHLGYSLTDDFGFYRDPQAYILEKIISD